MLPNYLAKVNKPFDVGEIITFIDYWTNILGQLRGQSTPVYAV
jgi:hypothetical protein